MFGISEMFYQMFWEKCGKNSLSLEDKINQLCKLRDLSLHVPYWTLKEDETIPITEGIKSCCQVPRLNCQDCRAFKKGRCQQKLTMTEMFQQLVPANLCKTMGHTHLSRLTGTLLYTMQTEIFKEIKELAEKGELTQEQIKQIGTF